MCRLDDAARRKFFAASGKRMLTLSTAPERTCRARKVTHAFEGRRLLRTRVLGGVINEYRYAA